MPQGGLKKVKSKQKPQRNKGVTKKGQRTVAPKSLKAKKSINFAKKHTSQHNAATEKSLAAKVGHLELLKGTRKEIENAKEESNK